MDRGLGESFPIVCVAVITLCFIVFLFISSRNLTLWANTSQRLTIVLVVWMSRAPWLLT